MGGAALRSVFTEFGFKFDDAGLQEGANKVADASKGIQTSLQAVAGKGVQQAFARIPGAFGTMVKGLNLTKDELAEVGTTAVSVMKRMAQAAIDFANGFAAQAETLRDTARESRVSTTELQYLQHAAVQSGIGVERMNSAVSTFGQSLRGAERWGNGTTFMLRRLGVQSRDAAGHIRPTAQLMEEALTQLARVPDPTRRAAYATQLFGASGRRLLDVATGIAAARREMEQLGGGVSQEAIAASREYTQAQGKLKVAMDSIRSVLATALLPALSFLATLVARIVGYFANLTKGTYVVKIALIGLAATAAYVAGSMIVAFAPVILPFLLIAAKIALLILILDDLWTFFNGGPSVIGDIANAILRAFGLGPITNFRNDLQQTWDFLKEMFAGMGEAVGDFVYDAIQWFARLPESISNAFGSVWDGVLGGFRSAWNWIVGQVQSFIRSLGSGALGSILRRVGLDVGAAADSLNAALAQPPPVVRATAGAAAAAAPAAPARTAGAPTPAGAQTVTVPGRPGASARPRTTNVTNAPVVHVHGVTDPLAAGREAAREVERQQRGRRDANHAQQGGED